MSSHGGSAEQPPPDPREFRAAWVATVANIDWPAKPGLPAAEQQAQAIAMLDRAQTLKLNALILQVRPAADALFPSSLEPWSEFLSGTQGQPPQPLWDPLAFWLREARARAIELHVWLNPYRARHSSAKSPLALPHIGLREPQAVKRYGEFLWMDPGEPAAAAQTLAVVEDLLKRYDVDGVHIDDYFYPYPIQQPGPAGAPASQPAPGAEPRPDQPFPDDEAFFRYRSGAGMLDRDDWRRANVDALVQALHSTIGRTRPGVKFGISPFGLGRPERRAPGVVGFSQFHKLYADVERWHAQGWLDYLAPQLYWPVGSSGQPFATLLDGWLRDNGQALHNGRHVWPGLYTSLLRQDPMAPLSARVWPAREVLEQIALTRQRGAAATADAPGASGHIHFSMVALMQDREGIGTQLGAGLYAEAALVPACPWLGNAVPAAPLLRPSTSAGQVALEGVDAATAGWAVWRRTAGQWRFAVLPGAARSIDPLGADRLSVAAVSRTGIVSNRTLLALR